MAAVTNHYRVLAHKEVGGKKVGVEVIAYVQASAGDYNSISAVLTSNGTLPGPGTIVLDHVQEVTNVAAIA